MSLPTRLELAQLLRQSFIGDDNDQPYNWEWLTPAQRRSWLDVADKAVASGAQVRPDPDARPDAERLAGYRDAIRRLREDCPHVRSIIEHFDGCAQEAGYPGDPRPEDEILYALVWELDASVTQLTRNLERAKAQRPQARTA